VSLAYAALAFFFFTSLWVWLDAPERGMTRWWGMASLVLWIVFFPLYLVLRATTRSGAIEPELLGNGDILVPVSEDGGMKMVRLEPGEDEHAEWLGYLQRRR
jgi:hypothetical protein